MIRALTLMTVLAASPAIASEGADVSGEFECVCAGNFCDENDAIQLKYNRESLRLDISGDTWTYSGYVTRQYNRTVDKVFLTVPVSHSLSTPRTLVVNADGQVELNGTQLDCRRI